MIRPIVFLLLSICLCTTCSRNHNIIDDLDCNSDRYINLLEHYSSHDSLKLKLRAAKFLTINMQGHYSYVGAYMDNYMKKIDSVYVDQPTYCKYVYYLIPSNYEHANKISHKDFDIDNISVDFLISWIDKSFILLNELPWLTDISFDYFCEYILPYRLMDGLPISDYYNHGDSIINELKPLYQNRNDIERIISSAIEISSKNIGNKVTYDQIPDSIIRSNPIDCHEGALSDYFFFRSLGFPITYDFTPHWGSRDGRHSWNAFVGYENMDTEGAAKIYRKVFSRQPKPQEELTGNFIPPFFEDNFVADVTNYYIKTNDYSFRINSQFEETKNIYLCVFNERKWHPIDWAPNIRNKARFKNLGNEIVYLPIYYRGKVETIADYPFILNSNGKVQKLKPDYSNSYTLTVSRKYPLSAYKMKWSDNFSGTQLEASNDGDFKNRHTIEHISNITLPDHMIKPSNTSLYKYWRIVSEKGIDVAEIKFINDSGEIVMPCIISPEGNYTNLFDNDKLSYVAGIDTITFQFEKPFEIREIIITPRNDGNYIYPGHTYSLFYMDIKGWKLHQTKRAEHNYIEFDNVPKGSLYWVRNLTEGVEERIFTADASGKIEFW